MGNHLASDFVNTPLAINPTKAHVILDALSGLLEISDDDQELEYSVQAGVAHIALHGILLKSDYTVLTAQIQRAIFDPNVKAVLLSVDSPGGVTGGLLDVCDFIYSCRGSKP